MKEILYQVTQFPSFQETQYLHQFLQNKKLTAISHRHDFYELVYILEGKVNHCVDEQSIFMQKNDFIILSPQNTHHFLWQSNTMHTFSLSIAPPRFQSFINAYAFEPKYAQIYRSKNMILNKAIESLLFTAIDNRKTVLNILLGKFFAEICAIDEITFDDFVPNFLSKALYNMRKRENLTRGVPAFVQLTGYSHAQLCRLTKKYYGKTPQLLIHEIRMGTIKDYLENTDYSLEVIAEEAGYASMSQFHNAIKAYFHCTPKQLRQKYH